MVLLLSPLYCTFLFNFYLFLVLFLSVFSINGLLRFVIMVCKKYQNEYKIFQEIVEGIMMERKSGLNPDDLKIKKIENEMFEKYEVEL